VTPPPESLVGAASTVLPEANRLLWIAQDACDGPGELAVILPLEE
jgi:hypothetical protein